MAECVVYSTHENLFIFLIGSGKILLMKEQIQLSLKQTENAKYNLAQNKQKIPLIVQTVQEKCTSHQLQNRSIQITWSVYPLLG